METLEIQNKGSTFKYQISFLFGAVIHISFLVLFFINEIDFLPIINIFSIVLYFIGAIVSSTRFFEKHHLMRVLLIYSDLMVHSVINTLWFGFETCFFLYAATALTVLSYEMCISYNNKDTFLKAIFPFVAVTFTSLLACYAFIMIKQPLISLLFHGEISADKLKVMMGINIFFNTFTVFFFSIAFIEKIHSLIKKLQDTNDRLSYIANHDVLTDLYNRRSLNELHDYLKSKDRSKGDYNNNIFGCKSLYIDSFCAIMGDVDNFKSINDTYGHAFGDLVLKSVADIIKKEMTENDIACRWGGEEFLIIMSGGKAECTKRTEAIRQNVEQLWFEEKHLSVTMTFGLVFCGENQDNISLRKTTKLNELVQIADHRLYEGKSRGKNVVVFQ